MENQEFFKNVVHLVDEEDGKALCNSEHGDTQNADTELVNCNKCRKKAGLPSIAQKKPKKGRKA